MAKPKFCKKPYIYSVVPKWKLALKKFCFIEGMMIGLGKRSPENMFRQNAYLEDTGKQKCFESVSIRHLKHQQMIVMIYLLISKESWWASGKEIFYWTNWNWSPAIFWQVNIYKLCTKQCTKMAPTIQGMDVERIFVDIFVLNTKV